MSDRLYQNLISATPAAEIDSEVLAHEISSTIRALGRGAESRPLPVDLDWSTLKLVVRPADFPGSEHLLRIEASASVR